MKTASSTMPDVSCDDFDPGEDLNLTGTNQVKAVKPIPGQNPNQQFAKLSIIILDSEGEFFKQINIPDPRQKIIDKYNSRQLGTRAVLPDDAPIYRLDMIDVFNDHDWFQPVSFELHTAKEARRQLKLVNNWLANKGSDCEVRIVNAFTGEVLLSVNGGNL